MVENNTTELPRSWEAYPEIQKDYPYSDQCIEELIVRCMEMIARQPRDTTPHKRQPGERGMYEIQRKEWYDAAMVAASNTKTALVSP